MDGKEDGYNAIFLPRSKISVNSGSGMELVPVARKPDAGSKALRRAGLLRTNSEAKQAPVSDRPCTSP